ncbi:unnamed protein product [Effrenium voratum]|nr:unnamed protein product [Effrenium voratum]
MIAQGVRSPNVKRRSGQQASHSPQSQYRMPARTGSVSPMTSPPTGGATPSTPAVPYLAHRGTSTPSTLEPRHPQDQSPNVRSAGSLTGQACPDRRMSKDGTLSARDGLKAPPTPRRNTGNTPRMPKRTPRLSPRCSWVNGPGPFNRKVLAEEEEKRRRRMSGEAGDLSRSASGSIEGSGGNARSSGYPVVAPPMPVAQLANGVEEHAPRPMPCLSGSTTPTDGGEGVPHTLLSRLRENPVLQVQDSRIMRMIGKRSVLKHHINDINGMNGTNGINCANGIHAINGSSENTVARSKGRAFRCPVNGSVDKDIVECSATTASARGDASKGVMPPLRPQTSCQASQEPRGESGGKRIEASQSVIPNTDGDGVQEPEPEKTGLEGSGSLAARAAAAVEKLKPAVETLEEHKAAYPESPRNCVADGVTDDSFDAAIVWPGMSSEKEEPGAQEAAKPPAAPEAPAREELKDVPKHHLPSASGADASQTAWAQPDAPLLQNEAGSVVVPQTWRFVPPPPEQAPKPSYEKEPWAQEAEKATLPAAVRQVALSADAAWLSYAAGMHSPADHRRT